MISAWNITQIMHSLNSLKNAVSTVNPCADMDQILTIRTVHDS